MLDEVVKRDALFEVSFLMAQAAWLQGNLQAAKEHLKKSWREANPSERVAVHDEMQHLFDQHPGLPGKDELQGIMI